MLDSLASPLRYLPTKLNSIRFDKHWHNDLGILKTAAKHSHVIAGIRASVLQGGIIRRHDPIWLESP